MLIQRKPRFLTAQEKHKSLRTPKPEMRFERHSRNLTADKNVFASFRSFGERWTERQKQKMTPYNVE